MREPLVRSAGLVLSVSYAETMAEVTGGLASSVGAYAIDSDQFGDGLAFFRKDQFPEARAALERADPARRDARTQFYIAYAFYRQGWGRLYHDNELYRRGLDAVNRAIALAPNGRLVIDDDPDLRAPSADELKAELEAGLTRGPTDFNPLRVLESRK
jgi:tetratricopeptide (TPR) repeat protein